MNKKFLSAVLFGALMVSSTGTFVSCKDYDEDIDRIDKELVDIKSALSALQAKVDAGKYVTNVVKNGDGITVTWSDNSTSTIETIKGDKGEDGKNGTVVTIIDGYWAFDGVKSEYPAKGDKGDKGDQGERVLLPLPDTKQRLAKTVTGWHGIPKRLHTLKQNILPVVR